MQQGHRPAGVVVLSKLKVNPPHRAHPPERPPRRKKPDLLRWSIVTFGALVVTASAINAADIAATLKGTFGGGASVGGSRCPPEMVFVPESGGGFCVDRYEVSTGNTCPFPIPTSAIQTNENISVKTCVPESAKGKTPWVNLSLSQAITLCAKAGKRLPTPGEWYRAALGTPDWTDASPRLCALGLPSGGAAEPTGSHPDCISSFGAYDMVGNVWEWVDVNIVDGVIGNRTLPIEGYVSEADVDGVPVSTSGTSSEVFGEDYFFNNPTGVRGMFRGGFWSLTNKAGIYSVNTTISTSFAGSAVGFRCVK